MGIVVVTALVAIIIYLIKNVPHRNRSDEVEEEVLFKPEATPEEEIDYLTSIYKIDVRKVGEDAYVVKIPPRKGINEPTLYLGVSSDKTLVVENYPLSNNRLTTQQTLYALRAVYEEADKLGISL